MVKERMDLLELLRKGGMDGDVDFLREALRVLVEGAELKLEHTYVSADQKVWLNLLPKTNTFVWRPSDWDEIKRIARSCSSSNRSRGTRSKTKSVSTKARKRQSRS